MEIRVDAGLAVVAVPELVRAHELAEPARVKLGAERLARPPREELKQAKFQGRGHLEVRPVAVAAVMSFGAGRVKVGRTARQPTSTRSRIPIL